MLQINRAKWFVVIFFIFIFIGCVYVYEYRANSYIPKDGFVPDEKTAIKIADVVLYPIYGETLENQKPFRATLVKNKIWKVEGTLPKNKLGGVVYIEIQKGNGAILHVSHGK
ncbi:MAG: YbbC/YhhH family protein [Treponema sp.]|jgi:hypothetical protein|nr:YbbC/YhhH family protein [Treponema sp.]